MVVGADEIMNGKLTTKTGACSPHGKSGQGVCLWHKAIRCRVEKTLFALAVLSHCHHGVLDISVTTKEKALAKSHRIRMDDVDAAVDIVVLGHSVGDCLEGK